MILDVSLVDETLAGDEDSYWALRHLVLGTWPRGPRGSRTYRSVQFCSCRKSTFNPRESQVPLWPKAAVRILARKYAAPRNRMTASDPEQS